MRSFLFAEGDDSGLDLGVLNIQRGRDLGVASYNDLREAVGLERAETFADVTSNPALAAELEGLYGDVDLIDAWIGGLAEDHGNGGLLGELFSTVIVDQFVRLRDGDPYWSETGKLPEDEIDALWSTTLSDIIERNTDVGVIQDNVFLAYDRIGGDRLHNELVGGDGRDLLLGEAGQDDLSGNAGDDQLVGGRGHDRLAGGAGNDLLEGGFGKDAFVFSPGETGENVIADFDRRDEIDLTGFAQFVSFADLDITGDASGTTLMLENDQSVELLGVTSDALDPDDFLLS